MIRIAATAFALGAILMLGTGCPRPAVTDGGTPAGDTGSSATDAGDVGMMTTNMVPGHEQVPIDPSHKEEPRLMPAETMIRSYLQLFGGLAPLAAQAEVLGQSSELFDTWNDYLQVIGLPDHRVDIGRNEQTSPLMLAAFERIGIALCDRAVVRDLRGTLPVANRVVFAFELPAAAPDMAAFAQRFEVLHVTFLGYPAALAPPNRIASFYELYRGAATRHATPPRAPAFNAAEAGWASVCYGLVRHPEFHLY